MNDWIEAKKIAEAEISKGKTDFKISRKIYSLENSFVVLKSNLYKVSRTAEGKLGDSFRSIVKRISNDSNKEFALKITKSPSKDFDSNEIIVLEKLGKELGHFAREKIGSIESFGSEFQYSYKQYTAMPIVSGSDLSKALTDVRNMSEHVRTKLAISFIENLMDLHEKGILPVDLLPQNIMVDLNLCKVETIDFESVLMLPAGETKVFVENYFSQIPQEQQTEFFKQSLPPENMHTGELPNKIIASIEANIWMAAKVMDMFGFPEMTKEMRREDPKERPTLAVLKEQLVAIKMQGEDKGCRLTNYCV